MNRGRHLPEIENLIVVHLLDMACENVDYHGWRCLDINWPAHKFLAFAEHRFGEQKKRVWSGVAKILDSYFKEERSASEYSFIRDWPY